MLLFSITDVARYLEEYIDEIDIEWCKVMTFGIWIPPIHVGGYGIRDFFEALQYHDIQTRVIVGYTNKDTVRERCYNILKRYPKLQMRGIKNFHAKGIVLSDGLSVFGSMNINDAHYSEVAIISKLNKDDMDIFETKFAGKWMRADNLP
jgi:hypothetical protein